MATSAGLRIIGLNALRQVFAGVIRAAERDRPRWWVGSQVIYANFHEFGTVNLPPRPFFRPAQRAVARRVEGVARALATESTSAANILQLAVSSDQIGYVARVACELELVVKQWIRIQSLIDTGNMRASFVAAPTVPQLKRKSANAVNDPSIVTNR